MKRAFTLKELLFVLIALFILALLLLPAFSRAKARSPQIVCVNNLKQIGVAFRLWSPDQSDAYPMRRSTNYHGSMEYAEKGSVFETYRSMSNELKTPNILTCPSDSRIPVTNFNVLNNSNVSYFIGLDAEETAPQMLLSGDRNLTTNGITSIPPGLVILKSNTVVSWTKKMHGQHGNLELADGSVQMASDAALKSVLNYTGTNLNRLVIP